MNFFSGENQDGLITVLQNSVHNAVKGYFQTMSDKFDTSTTRIEEIGIQLKNCVSELHSRLDSLVSFLKKDVVLTRENHLCSNCGGKFDGLVEDISELKRLFNDLSCKLKPPFVQNAEKCAEVNNVGKLSPSNNGPICNHRKTVSMISLSVVFLLLSNRRIISFKDHQIWLSRMINTR